MTGAPHAGLRLAPHEPVTANAGIVVDCFTDSDGTGVATVDQDTLDLLSGTYTCTSCDGGRCLLCLTERLEGKRLHVDHCHEMKKVRGLLCDLCNRGLDCFREAPGLLEATARYLEETRQ